MADLWIMSIPAAGHIHPKLALAKELVNSGDRVCFFGFDRWKKRIEKTGACYVSMDPYLPALSQKEEQAMESVNTTIMSIKALQTTENANGFLAEMLQKSRPDLIVADSVCFWGKLLAAREAIPLVVDTTTFAFNKQSARYMKSSFQELWHLISGLPKVQRKLDSLQSLGYPKTNMLDLIQNDDKTPAIVYTSRLIQPCADSFGNHICFCGAGLSLEQIETARSLKQEKIQTGSGKKAEINAKQNTNRNENQQDSWKKSRKGSRSSHQKIISNENFSSWNENPHEDQKECWKRNQKITRKENRNENQEKGVSAVPDFPGIDPDWPLVYISLGTVLKDPDFYQTCMQALKSLPVRVLISAGSSWDAFKDRQLPKNVVIQPYVSQLEVLAEASCFTTHCGMNSMSESVMMEVPMVLVPFTSEQRAVAKRIEELHGGIRLSKPKPEFIQKAVLQILQVDEYKKAVKKLHQSQLDSGLIPKAVSFIHQVLEDRTGQLGSTSI